MTTNRARHAIWTAVMTLAVVVAVPAALYSLPSAEPPALPFAASDTVPAPPPSAGAAPAAPAGSPVAALRPATAPAAAPSPGAAAPALAPAAAPAAAPSAGTPAPAAAPAAPKEFTGIGTLPRAHSRAEASAPAAARADTTSPYPPAVLNEQPRLENGAELGTAMKALFPKMLWAAGVSGSTEVQFVIKQDGTVDSSTVKVVSTSNPQFSEPSVKAIELARFSPGTYNGQPVRVLVRMPITWKAPARPPADSTHR